MESISAGCSCVSGEPGLVWSGLVWSGQLFGEVKAREEAFLKRLRSKERSSELNSDINHCQK